MNHLNNSHNRQGVGKIVLLFFLVWLAVVGYASYSGMLLRLPVYIAPILLVVMAVILVALYFTLSGFQTWVNDQGLFRLTALHIWRIAAAGVFFWYDYKNLLPDSFVDNAAWGDLVVGLFAFATVMVPMTVKHYRFFHIVGLLDLVIVISTGIVLTMMGEAHMENIMMFPISLIPLVGAPIFLASHLLAFYMIKKEA